MLKQLKFCGLSVLLFALPTLAQVTASGGASGVVPEFTGTSTLGPSVITQSSGRIGVGTTSPTYTLDVAGPIRTTGLVSEASVATTWGSYVNTNISANGQLLISVAVSGGNSYWNGLFLVQGTNSQTANATFNNAELLSWSGYNAQMNDVQALIMSNSPTTGFGSTYLVFLINGPSGVGPGYGTAATFTMSALGGNVSQINLSSSNFTSASTMSAAAPYADTMASSQNTYSITSGTNTITQAAGNVGVGTTTPSSKFNVYGGISTFNSSNTSQYWATDVLIPENAAGINDPESSPYAGMRLLGYASPAGAGGGISWGMAPQANNTWLSGGYTTGQFLLAYNGNNLQLQGSNQNSGPSLSFTPSPFLTVSNTGNVGIGTTNPGVKLEVDGNLKLTAGSGASMTYPDGTVQSTAWNGTTVGGDYAESVDVLGDRETYEPGDLIVIDGTESGKFAKSDKPYSRLVAGVYSTKPGLVGRRVNVTRPDEAAEVPMAMMGIVPTKVSTENGPIERGDLLVSSSKPGYAMKGTDHDLLLGSVVGKALAPLKTGFGVIEALISIQ